MIPIPRGEFAPPLGRPVKYRIHMLSIGESLFLPRVSLRNIKSTISRMQERNMFFQSRRACEDGISGLRVIRISPPTFPRPRYRPPKYPLRDLAIGQSIIIPGKIPSRARCHWAGISGMKFKSRSVMCRGIVSTKVWRIS